MFEFIKENYPVLFTDDDLAQFLAAGWITSEEAEAIQAEE